ncbi:predicted protein [Histoplasma capsulatum G186AR]|uniref:Uncharacterized protein n=1 Tax=Ajellomyces capsulatus (strain G186AR / H82 / ATCC MYA-2454 / RMSCC 2432) TaxID=447093 RepID=C0NZQ6_AJECG|nr:uncharacterized protein HCBG_08636 [Histoplasma capsulatum G186AR]EEH02996.1 predicted protein [Histoplasma capsulatum G186AR]
MRDTNRYTRYLDLKVSFVIIREKYKNKCVIQRKQPQNDPETARPKENKDCKIKNDWKSELNSAKKVIPEQTNEPQDRPRPCHAKSCNTVPSAGTVHPTATRWARIE